MKDLNVENSSFKEKERGSFLLSVKEIREKLEKVFYDITDYTYNHKKDIDKLVVEVNKQSSRLKKAPETIFKDKTNEFRKKLNDGESIDSILVEALALIREAIKRTYGMYAYDTQIEAAIAMIGKKNRVKIGSKYKEIYPRVISEMQNGEGKSLVQMIVAYIDLLEATKDENKDNHKCVHIMTSSDLIARRDFENSKELFELLGFTSGFVLSKKGYNDLSDSYITNYKKRAYESDVVYATPSTIAFDFLHDNIVMSPKNKYIKKPLGFAVLDSTDNIIIENSINPLKLSAAFENFDDNYEELLKSSDIQKKKAYIIATTILYGLNGSDMTPKNGLTYHEFDTFLNAKNNPFNEDYAICKDTGDIILSKKLEDYIANLFNDDEMYNQIYFALIKCIMARHMYVKDKDYELKEQFDYNTNKMEYKIVQKEEKKKISKIYIRGIQEALEAKEEYLENYSEGAKKRFHVSISNDMPIRAVISYSDFLSMYDSRVSGLSDNASIDELKEIFGFETYVVEKRKKDIRVDDNVLYATKESKFNAIVKEALKCSKNHQPLLLVTNSVKERVQISELLRKNNINHNLINTNNEYLDNELVKRAGMYGAISVLTCNTGNDIEIKIGGPNATIEEQRYIKELGGLYIIGTSKNKNPRIEEDIRSRVAHQGDPGRTRIFYSLEDDLIKEIYNGDMLDYLKEHYDTNKPIRNPKVIDFANKCQLSDYEDEKENRINIEYLTRPFAKQRKNIYNQRNALMYATDSELNEIIRNVITKYTNLLVEEKSIEDIEALIGHIINVRACSSNNRRIFKDNIALALKDRFRLSNPDFSELRKKMLNVIDVHWVNHIAVLQRIKNTNIAQLSDDTYSLVEQNSSDIFNYELLPRIYNEMITYACLPDIKFGNYSMKETENYAKLI